MKNVWNKGVNQISAAKGGAQVGFRSYLKSENPKNCPKKILLKWCVFLHTFFKISRIKLSAVIYRFRKVNDCKTDWWKKSICF